VGNQILSLSMDEVTVEIMGNIMIIMGLDSTGPHNITGSTWEGLEGGTVNTLAGHLLEDSGETKGIMGDHQGGFDGDIWVGNTGNGVIDTRCIWN
jgi:hypothetical protein